jgi:3',5'-cyclic AMP phosphodiesterase CpdA
MKRLDRRKFIYSISASAAVAATLPFTGFSMNKHISSKEGVFSFVILGDMHFDKFEHHDVQYMLENYPNDIRQVINYAHLTWQTMPELMRVTKAKASEIGAAFFLQLGDFLEGLCGSKELASLQATEFIQFISDQDLQRPFLVTKGNHDITGIGAREVYAETVLPWQQKELQQPVESSNVTFVHKNARFVMFDGYAGAESLDWLKIVLADHKEDHLFFCVHEPVVPYNARSTWHVFNRDLQRREELVNLLGKHRAIVMGGHLHKATIVTRNTPYGNFVQVGLGSVIPASKISIKDHLKGVENYSSELLKLEPDFSPATLIARKEVLEREAPHIRYFEYADFCGYGTITVNDNNEVVLGIYPHTDSVPWNTFNLSKLLKA